MAVVGVLPSWLDVNFAQNAAAVVAVVAAAVVLIVVFIARSVATRLVAVVVLGAAVFGLLHYRTELDHCSTNGCQCSLFGEDLKGGDCAP